MHITNSAIKLVNLFNSASKVNNTACTKGIKDQITSAINKFNDKDFVSNDDYEVICYLAFCDDSKIYSDVVSALFNKIRFDDLPSLENLKYLYKVFFAPQAKNYSGTNYILIVDKSISCLDSKIQSIDNVYQLIENLKTIMRLLDLALRLRVKQKNVDLRNNKELSDCRSKIEKIKEYVSGWESCEVNNYLFYIDLQLRQFTENKSWTTAITEKTKAFTTVAFHVGLAAAEGSMAGLLLMTGFGAPAAVPLAITMAGALMDCTESLGILFSRNSLQEESYFNFRSVVILFNMLKTSLLFDEFKNILRKEDAFDLIFASINMDKISENILLYIIIQLQDAKFLAAALDYSAFYNLLKKLGKHAVNGEQKTKNEWYIVLYVIQTLLGLYKFEKQDTILKVSNELMIACLNKFNSEYKNDDISKTTCEFIAIKKVLQHHNDSRLKSLINVLQRSVAEHYQTKENDDAQQSPEAAKQEQQKIAIDYGLYVREQSLISALYDINNVAYDPKRQKFYSQYHKYPELSTYYFELNYTKEVLPTINFASSAAADYSLMILLGSSGSGKTALAADIVYRVAYETGLSERFGANKKPTLIWWFESAGFQGTINKENSAIKKAYQLWDYEYTQLAKRLNLPNSELPSNHTERMLLLESIATYLNKENFSSLLCFDNVPNFESWSFYHKNNGRMLLSKNCHVVMVPSALGQRSTWFSDDKVVSKIIDLNENRDTIGKINQLADVFLAILFHESLHNNPDKIPLEILRENMEAVTQRIPGYMNYISLAKEIVAEIPLLMLVKLAANLFKVLNRKQSDSMPDQLRSFKKYLTEIKSNTMINDTSIETDAEKLFYQGDYFSEKMNSNSKKSKFNNKRRNALYLAAIAKSIFKHIMECIKAENETNFPYVERLMLFIAGFDQEIVNEKFLSGLDYVTGRFSTIKTTLDRYGLIVNEEMTKIDYLRRINLYDDDEENLKIHAEVDFGAQIRMHRIVRFLIKEHSQDRLDGYRTEDSTKVINQLYADYYDYYAHRNPGHNRQRAQMLNFLLSLTNRNFIPASNQQVVSGNLPAEIQGKLYLMQGVSYWDVGHFTKSVDCFKNAQKGFSINSLTQSNLQPATPSWLARSHHYAGIAQKSRSHYMCALEEQFAALRYASNIHAHEESLQLKSSIYHELAILNWHFTNFDQAISYIDNAMQCVTKDTSEYYLILARKSFMLARRKSNICINDTVFKTFNEILEKRNLKDNPLKETDTAAILMMYGFLYACCNQWKHADRQFFQARAIYLNSYTSTHVKTIWASFLLLQMKVINNMAANLPVRINAPDLKEFYKIFHRYLEARHWHTDVLIEHVIISYYIAKLYHYSDHQDTVNEPWLGQFYFKSIELVDLYIEQHIVHGNKDYNYYYYMRKIYLLKIDILKDVQRVPLTRLCGYYQKQLAQVEQTLENTLAKLNQHNNNYFQSLWLGYAPNIIRTRLLPHVEMPMVKVQQLSHHHPVIHISDYGVY